MTKSERNKLLIGIGCGMAAGFGTGYLVCSNRKEKRHREELKQAKRRAYTAGIEKGKDPVQLKNAYMSGVDEGLRDAKHYIDNLKKVLDQDGMHDVVEKVDKMMEEDSKPTGVIEGVGTITESESGEQNIVLKDFPEDCNGGWIKISGNEIAFFEKDGEDHASLLKDKNGKVVVMPVDTVIGEDGTVFDDETLKDHFAKRCEDPDTLKDILRVSCLISENENVDEAVAGSGDKVTEEPVVVNSPIKIIGQADYDSEKHQVVFKGAAGTKIAYPATLFIGPDGEVLDSIDIRNNIRKHEHNLARLNLIWSQMGWGAYVPDLDGPVGAEVGNSIGEPVNKEVSEEDINNWDLNIDGDTYADSDLLMGDEPEEKTREREKYLDEVNRYIANPEEAPRIISRQEFEDECYLDKVYFDYYDVDNKFIENTNVNDEIGPYDYFGITDGKELFNRKSMMVPDPDDDDPDIVHVKNFKMNCVIEVTRYHRSYEAIKDGGAYIQDGSTN